MSVAGRNASGQKSEPKSVQRATGTVQCRLLVAHAISLTVPIKARLCEIPSRDALDRPVARHSLSVTSQAEPTSPVDLETDLAPKRVLVVEPHPTLRTVLAQRLRQDGHLTAAVATAREALELCADQNPDLLVSAEILEHSSALRLASQLRCPAIVLTARSGAEPVVTLLDAGAHDVLRKPFGLEELAARCRAMLRRGSTGLQEQVCVGPLKVHLLLRQVTLQGQPVELSPREFALLCALLMPPGMVRSRQQLLRMAWPPFSGGPRAVDTQVLTLRRKLEQAGLGESGGITTVRQHGYRFSIDTIPVEQPYEEDSTRGSAIATVMNQPLSRA